MVGLGAVALSIWLLYHELRGISVADLEESFAAISMRGWALACASTFAAYAALAGYDHIALMHLRRKISPVFVTLTSFTAYALAHNIGASVFSGAVVRYRAYSSRGLTTAEIGVLVAFCSFTFALGTLFLTGLVLLVEPGILERFVDMLPLEASATTGVALLTLVALYVLGSWLHLKPLKIGGFELQYPRLPIVARQLLVGPVELLAAAGIVYFALPEAGNPGYLIVLGIFLVSFSIAQISHAPGGLGVFEVVFLAGLSDMDPARVVAALLAFRLLYLIIPLLIGLVVVVLFEHSQFGRRSD